MLDWWPKRDRAKAFDINDILNIFRPLTHQKSCYSSLSTLHSDYLAVGLATRHLPDSVVRTTG